MPNPQGVSALAIDPRTPSTLYAGTSYPYDYDVTSGIYNGVFQSTNSGASWTATGLINPRGVSALAIDPTTPSTLYAGTGTGGVFQSTNSGGSWTAVNTGLPTNAPVTALAIDPKRPSTLYAGAGGDGVFQSTNSGGSWIAVNTGLPPGPYGPIVHVLAIDPTTPSTLYVEAAEWVYRSTDSGASWAVVGNTSPDSPDATCGGQNGCTALAIDPTTPSTLYVGTWAESCSPLAPACSYSSVVYQSTDSGTSWMAISLPWGASVGVLAIDPMTPSRLYAATAAGVFDIELTCVVGTGTGASCTESALDACLPGGAGFTGTVTFNCGGAATITVTSTKTISADTTIDGGSLITISGGNSVGVFAVNTGVNFAVQNLTIANGRSGAGGSGIFNNGMLTVTNSTFSGNYAGQVWFPGCSSGGGAGIHNGGMLTVTNSTFSGNTVVCGGDGIIYSVGTGMVTNSTFSDNYVDGIASGISVSGGTLTVTNSTFSAGGINNGGGTLTVTNTIVANSTAGDNCSGGPITDGGHNIDDGTTCGFSTANGSLNNTDPKLDPAGLANNGGPTLTIALLPGSPAINAGDQAICAAPPVNGVDQRGYVRPGSGSANCSIGAFEFNSPGPLCDVGDCNSDGQVTIDELITLVNIALGNAQPSVCPYGVPSGDEVNVALIIQAVNNALNGCGSGR
jgi:hypothetical protein